MALFKKEEEVAAVAVVKQAPQPTGDPHEHEQEIEKQCVTINIYCGGCGSKPKQKKD